MTLTYTHAEEYVKGMKVKKKKVKHRPESWADIKMLHTFVNRARGVSEIASKIAYISAQYADSCFANKRANKKIIDAMNERNWKAAEYLKQTFYELDPLVMGHIYRDAKPSSRKIKKTRKRRRPKKDISWKELTKKLKNS